MTARSEACVWHVPVVPRVRRTNKVLVLHIPSLLIECSPLISPTIALQGVFRRAPVQAMQSQVYLNNPRYQTPQKIHARLPEGHATFGASPVPMATQPNPSILAQLASRRSGALGQRLSPSVRRSHESHFVTGSRSTIRRFETRRQNGKVGCDVEPLSPAAINYRR